MKRYWFLTLMCIYTGAGILSAQEVVFVNTDNLVLRDRPEKTYNVFAILHAPCELKVEPYEDGYKNDKAVTGRFYQVSLSYDERGIHHYIGGWVLKKYVVLNRRDITIKGLNTMSQAIPPVQSLFDEAGISRDKFNAALFQLPKYKGGEKQPAPLKKAYHKGPRGGCFYIGSKGQKVYVDKRFCNGR